MNTALDAFITGYREIRALPATERAAPYIDFMASETCSMAASVNPRIFMWCNAVIIKDQPENERAGVFEAFRQTAGYTIAAQKAPQAFANHCARIIETLPAAYASRFTPA